MTDVSAAHGSPCRPGPSIRGLDSTTLAVRDRRLVRPGRAARTLRRMTDMKPMSHEVTRRDGARPGPGDAAGGRDDRRRLGQGAGRRRVELERGHALQHAARPARQAGQGGRARGGRLPARVRHHRGERRHLDGSRGHARLARQPRDHRRLGRVHDARRAHGRARHVRRLRQEPARDAHGRGPAQPPERVPLRRLDHARPVQGPGARRRERVRGGRRVRGRHAHRERARRDREAGVSDRGLVRRDVHRQHDGVGGRGDRHEPARQRVARGRRPSSRRLRVRVRPRGDARSSSGTSGPATS